MECFFCGEPTRLIDPENQKSFCSNSCQSNFYISARFELAKKLKDGKLPTEKDGKVSTKLLQKYINEVLVNVKTNLKFIQKYAKDNDELYIVFRNFLTFLYSKELYKYDQKVILESLMLYSYITKIINEEINRQKKLNPKKSKQELLENSSFIIELIDRIFVSKENSDSSRNFLEYYPNNFMNQISKRNIDFYNINIFSKKIDADIYNPFFSEGVGKKSTPVNPREFIKFCERLVENIELIIKYCSIDIENLEKNKKLPYSYNSQNNTKEHIVTMISIYSYFVGYMQKNMRLLEQFKVFVNEIVEANDERAMKNTSKVISNSKMDTIYNIVNNKVFVTINGAVITKTGDVVSYIFKLSNILKKIIRRINSFKSININSINLLLIEKYTNPALRITSVLTDTEYDPKIKEIIKP